MNWRAYTPAVRCVVTAALVAGFAGAAHAQAQHDRPAVKSEKVAPTASGSATQSCGFGFDTRIGAYAPPDDSTIDNIANGVGFVKNCRGPVLGIASAETVIPPGGFIHADLLATCVVPSGSDPCVAGEQIFASPGHMFLRHTAGDYQVQTVQMIWPDLGTGRWRFQFLVGGDGTSFVNYRSLSVQAFR
jgi:hypothetical protein